jgi:hypothetical protein
MNKWIERGGIALAALVLAGCGPSTEEVGGAVLMVTPLALLAMMLPTALLRAISKQYRKVESGRDYLPTALALAGTFGAFVVGFVRFMQISDDLPLLIMAAFATTSSALLYGQLSWLLFESRAVKSTYGTFLLPTIMITHIIPASVLLFHDLLGLDLKPSDAQGVAFWLWAVPGFYYLPGGVVFLVLLVFVIRKRRMSAKHADISDGGDHVADIMS